MSKEFMKNIVKLLYQKKELFYSLLSKANFHKELILMINSVDA